jgi:hypothetical protein
VGKFPGLNTIEEVIDVVVMCIHIASLSTPLPITSKTTTRLSSPTNLLVFALLSLRPLRD